LLLHSVSASSVLALATTFHLGLALLRQHRRSGRAVSPVVLLSFSFTALPWILPSPVGVGVGIILHIAWYIACENLLPPTVAHAAVAPPARQGAATASTVRVTPPAGGRTAETKTTRPTGFVQTPVIATFEETSDIKTIRMLRPDGFEFDAGQFLALRIRADGREAVRCYSISSAPHTRGYLDISVKRQGTVSNALHATARPGATLSVKAPAGQFRYPSGDDRPVLLIAGGIGITPLLSMLRHAVNTEPTRPVTLIYSAHDESAFSFRDELGTIARRHPQVRMYFAATAATRPGIYRGRIDEALLRGAVPDLPHSIACLCGPVPMIEAVRALLTTLGVPAPQVRYEVFQAAVAIANREDHEVALAPGASGPTAGAPPLDIHFAASGRHAPAQPGQSVLDAAEAAGVEVPSLCRVGVCGTCRVRVTEGHVHCGSAALAADERAQGVVLACVSTISSDCTVQL
jgi:ferredoxin-NADP reductase